MELTINGIKRECVVKDAPKGSYCVIDYDEGCYFFPLFIVIAEALTEEEKSCGDIVVGAIYTANMGYETVDVGDIFTILYPNVFKRILKGAFYTTEYEDIYQAVKQIKEDFMVHGIPIHPKTLEYIEKKEFIRDLTNTPHAD